jgi:PIN domain nuclease of toxin-antitoxin system
MILVDTHALLWWQAGSRRLSARASREIAKADVVLISPISCWETAVLVSKGRVALDRDVFVWIRDLFDDEHVDLAGLSPQAAAGAGFLPTEGFRGDPADCLIYSTARELAVPLVTKDSAIREHATTAGGIRTIW